jgi:hypothetical protein
LDDEEDQRIGMALRGRTQIKPISISRSSTVSAYLMTGSWYSEFSIDKTYLSGVNISFLILHRWKILEGLTEAVQAQVGLALHHAHVAALC